MNGENEKKKKQRSTKIEEDLQNMKGVGENAGITVGNDDLLRSITQKIILINSKINKQSNN